jgi:geranylgeranyl pyrophosphate synthase
MNDFFDLLQYPFNLVLGRYIRQSSCYIQSILKKQQLPHEMAEHIQLLFCQKGKIFSSPTITGEPLSDADYGMWSLHAGLSYSAALGIDGFPVSARVWKRALPIAAMAEFLGLALDIVDDIQDGDAQFPGKQALTVSLALLSAAFQSISCSNLPLVVRIEIHKRLAAALFQSTIGQYLDIAFENRNDVTEEMSVLMTRRKSGSLLGLVYEAGAIAGASLHHPRHDVQAIGSLFQRFGEQLGLRFQLLNDLRDTEITSTKSDRLLGKQTLPLVLEREFAIDKMEHESQIAAVITLVNMAIKKANREAAAILKELATSYKIQAIWLNSLTT